MKRNIPFAFPDITDAEIQSVMQTLKDTWITTGPRTKKFEQEIAKYVGTEKAVCLNSATAAMEMTLRILGIGPGDEVITTAYTYTATASVIHHVGAKIVLIDTELDSYEMNYEKLYDAISKKTKMIIPVDIGGKMCDYNRIFQILEDKKSLFSSNNVLQKSFGRIIIMADGAHSIGASYKGMKSGQAADFTCFSFHSVKNLTTGEGGAVVWKSINGMTNDDIYKLYMLYSLHGQTKDTMAKTKIGSWEYDIIYPAYKCNMTDVTAAIGLVQLARYEEILKRRFDIIKRYDEAFCSLDIKILKHIDDSSISSAHLYLVRVNGCSEEKRNKIIQKMSDCGIGCNVHYKPLPMLTAYKNMGFDIKNFPNAFNQYKNVISIPLHNRMSDDDISYVIKYFNKIIRE